jgi:outer membrane protein N
LQNLNRGRYVFIGLGVMLMYLAGESDLFAAASSPSPETGLPADPGNAGQTKRPPPSVEAAATKKQEASIAREVEAQSDEDPLAERQAAKEADAKAAAEQPNSIAAYASLRIKYGVTDDGSGWSDGGSRVGVDGQWQFIPRYWFLGRAEAGFNLMTGLDALQSEFDSNASAPEGQFADSVFKRLLYVGLETPNTYLIFGKNWSTYYKIAGYTDRFSVGGGNASGAYNAGTDGGASGTGRPNYVLQTRMQLDIFPSSWGIAPFNLNVQIQQSQPIPLVSGQKYGTQFGLSAVLRTQNNYTIGLGYNQSNISNVDNPDVVAAGIRGNDQDFIIGSHWYGKNWYLGTVVSRLLNHMTTDEEKYFDTWGWEVFSSYTFVKKYTLTAGLNYLYPDSDQAQIGEYKLQYEILGLRYHFTELKNEILGLKYDLTDLNTYVYVQAQFDQGRYADGTQVGNSYYLGFRWDLP